MDANDLADGFGEWVKQDEARDIDSPELRDELARLFECVRTETEARVVEAAAQEVKYVLDEDLMDHARLVRRIRALAPSDYVAVRREDFEVLTQAAQDRLDLIAADNSGWRQWREAQGEPQRIRAALSRARKGG